LADIPFIPLRFNETDHCFQRILKTRQGVLVAFGFIRELALQRSLIIEKRGTPRAVLLRIRDYVKLAAPESEVLRNIGEESMKKGTNTLTSRQIDQIIKATRAQKKKH
jgi:DNA topoisomerase VI subunit B